MLAALELPSTSRLWEGAKKEGVGLDWWALRTSCFPLASAFLLSVCDGDPLPRFSAGMSDLFQLLQPPAQAQVAGLQTHLLLSVPPADEDKPEGREVPLVPGHHQAAPGLLRVAAPR